MSKLVIGRLNNLNDVQQAIRAIETFLNGPQFKAQAAIPNVSATSSPAVIADTVNATLEALRSHDLIDT